VARLSEAGRAKLALELKLIEGELRSDAVLRVGAVGRRWRCGSAASICGGCTAGGDGAGTLPRWATLCRRVCPPLPNPTLGGNNLAPLRRGFFVRPQPSHARLSNHCSRWPFRWGCNHEGLL
jgi:hypothetical protein